MYFDNTLTSIKVPLGIYCISQSLQQAMEKDPA